MKLMGKFFDLHKDQDEINTQIAEEIVAVAGIGSTGASAGSALNSQRQEEAEKLGQALLAIAKVT